jgi:hypothetical protein
VPLSLSPEFYYRRLRIISSQVSNVGSGLQPRWTFARRTSVAFSLLRQPWLKTPATRQVPFERAPEAYQLLDKHPDEVQAVLLSYP